MDKRKHWIIYSSLFVVLIGAFLWYHFRYVPSQKRELAGRLLRVLATTGDEIRAELLSIVAPLTNTLGSAVDELKSPATAPKDWDKWV